MGNDKVNHNLSLIENIEGSDENEESNEDEVCRKMSSDEVYALQKKYIDPESIKRVAKLVKENGSDIHYHGGSIMLGALYLFNDGKILEISGIHFATNTGLLDLTHDSTRIRCSHNP